MQFLTNLAPDPWISAITDNMANQSKTAAQPTASQTIKYCSAIAEDTPITTGQTRPGAGASTSIAPWTGITWTNPSNITTSNLSTFITSNAYTVGMKTYMLRGTSFGFSAIPDNATIIGIKVVFQSQHLNTVGSSLGLLQLLDDTGALIGTNMLATPLDVAATWQTYTYGGIEDLWGATLTPAIVKNSNFGFAVGGIQTNANADIYFYDVTMEVFYSTPSHPWPGIPDGSITKPWTLAQLSTTLATPTANLYVYMSGTFEPVAYNSAGPLLDIVEGCNNTTLDFYTNSAVMRTYTGTTWTASGNEYWATVATTSPFVRVTEDGINMEGVNAFDIAPSRMLITATDAGADTVTFVVYRIPQVNDKIVFLSTAAAGLSPGITYYIKSIVGSSGASYTVTLSTSIGGATLDITAVLSSTDNKFLWSTINGHYADPVIGSLVAGQYAYAPDEGRIYIRPSSGTISDHTYTLHQSNSLPHLLRAAGATLDTVKIIGGTFYGAGQDAIALGNDIGLINGTVTGSTVHGCLRGIVTQGTTNSIVRYCHVHHVLSKGIGSIGLALTSHENNSLYEYNWIHDMDSKFQSGDCEAVVFNVSADICVARNNVIQRIGYFRDFVTNPLPPSLTIGLAHNIGAFVLDDSTNFQIYGNYVQDVYGRVCEFPVDSNHDCSAFARNNVFDQRGLLPYTVAVNGCTIVPNVFRMFVANIATPHAGRADIYNNIVIVGDVLIGDGGWDASIFQTRCAKSNLAVDMVANIHNNMVILDNNTAPWIIHAIRSSGTSPTMLANMKYTSDSNCYVYGGSNTAALGYARFTASTGQTVPDSSVTLGNMAGGFTGPSGIPCDFHSQTRTETHSICTDLGELVEASSLIRAGTHVKYCRDLTGIQRSNPPCIGLYDIITKSVR